jgi:hypothetical protein
MMLICGKWPPSLSGPTDVARSGPLSPIAQPAKPIVRRRRFGRRWPSTTAAPIAGISGLNKSQGKAGSHCRRDFSEPKQGVSPTSPDDIGLLPSPQRRVRLRRDRDEGRDGRAPPPRRGHLSNVQRLEAGRLGQVQVDLHDTYGPTVTEAVRALEACFDMCRQEQLPKRQ